MNIDLRNTTTLTILAIACILIFTCVYVMVIKPSNVEGFAESVLATGDTVRLMDGLRSVMLGSGASGGNAADYINSMMPALSVIAYAGDVAPAGWQICNGLPLRYTNGDPVTTTDDQGTVKNILTPNLKGRVIVGANPTVDTANGLSVRTPNQYGGEENHTLDITEMPAHNHTEAVGYNNCSGGSCPRLKWQDVGYTNDIFNTGNTGGDPSNNNKTKPHNNMQPFLVLNYIIKQPVKP